MVIIVIAWVSRDFSCSVSFCDSCVVIVKYLFQSTFPTGYGPRALGLRVVVGLIEGVYNCMRKSAVWSVLQGDQGQLLAMGRHSHSL